MGEGVRLVDRLQDAATVRRSFGEPIRHDGVTIIPVAKVAGGGGGGDAGQAAEGGPEGAGGGFGLRIAPCGVFVVREDKVRWQPSVDVNRIVLGGQIVAIVALVTIRSILRRRGAPVCH